MTKILFRYIAFIFMPLFLLGVSFSVSASHFRGGSISWQAVELDADGQKNDATITVVTAWRLDGDNIPGISLTPSVSVTTVSGSKINVGADYTLRTDVFQVSNLDLNTRYLITNSGCCRISTLVNNSDGNWDIQAEIFLKDDNLAPKIDLPILFDVPQLQSDGVTTLTDFTFKVNTADPNADSIRYRLANSSEMGGGSNPAGFAINANTGVVTWAGSGALASGLYSAGVIAEDIDSTGAIKSKSGADFILDLQNLAGVQFSTTGGIPSSNTVVVNKGDTFSFGITSGTSTITSTSLGDLSGTLTETTENNYVFTPGANGSGLEPGTYPVTIEIVDSSGLTTNSYLAITFIVTNPDAPTITNIEGDTVTYASTAEILIDASTDAILTDADDTNLNGGSLKLQVIFEDSEWEILGITSVGDGAGEIRVTGSEIFYEGNKIGDINSIENGAGIALQIGFTSVNATLNAVQALIRSLNYTDTFLLRDVSVRGLTLVVTDGDANSNSYRVNVDVQGHPGAPSTGSPLQASNRITLQNLGSIILTPSQLRYVDPDGTAPSSITLTASSITNGQFELITNAGVAITSFTQEQVNNGQVKFIHTVPNTLPTYSISADDGVDAATAPAAASIFFSVTSTDTASMAENQTAAGTITSAIVAVPIDFSIVSGDDRTLFSIDSSTGALTFISAPDAEIPTDADTDGVYIVDVRITDGQVNDIQTMSVTVTDVNDNVVVITSNGGGATALVNVNENTGAVTTVVAQDDISSTIAYSITGGVDQADFTINSSSGDLAFVNLPDFEAPVDSDNNNTYVVEVTVDVSGTSDTQTITVAVQPVNEAAPVFTSAATFAPNEGGTVIGSVTATDADLDSLTYTLTGGADQAAFSITSAGVLRFNVVTDFDNPVDSDANNSYIVEVTVTDGINSTIQTITVDVQDVIIADADGDSVPDVFESAVTDTDGDGTPDAADTDSDGDGIADADEIGLTGIDTDGDGIDDAFDVDQTGGTDANGDGFDDNAVFTDADGDGIPDYLDSDDGSAPGSALGGDSDGDGVPDQVECPSLPCADTDGDGIPDYADASTAIVSPNLADVDTGLKGIGSFNPLFLLMFLLLRFIRSTKKAVFMTSLVFLISMTTAANAGENKNALSWHIGAGAGLSTIDPDTSNTIFNVDDDTDVGYKIFAGYQFTEDWFAELDYNNLGKATMQTFGEIKYKVISLGARYNFFDIEVGGKDLVFFAKAGVASLDTSSNIPVNTINSTQVFYGAGIEYTIIESVALRAELELYDEDASLASLSVVKYFGRKSKASKEKIIQDKPAQAEPVQEAQTPEKVEAVVIVLDADSDGVVDADDKCPDSKKETTVDETGCSIFKGQLESIQFEAGSDQLTDESKMALDNITKTFIAYPLLSVEVQAYTDSVGKKEKNLELSRKRAQSVVDYLVAKGVSENRLTAEGYGEENPVADNSSPEGRAANRRVEFKALSK